MKRTAGGTLWRGVLSAGVVAMLALLAAPAGAGEEEEMAARGRVTFRVYCSNCHGAGATGNGELAKYLTVAPADLTRIAERNDGNFPADWLYKVIDGRELVRGHGAREMPVWGVGFPDPGKEAEQAAEVRQKIEQLVAYLRTIQTEEAAEGEQSGD